MIFIVELRFPCAARACSSGFPGAARHGQYCRLDWSCWGWLRFWCDRSVVGTITVSRCQPMEGVLLGCGTMIAGSGQRVSSWSQGCVGSLVGRSVSEAGDGSW